jgi:uncharacterized repeat protein (TIGR01451 family)
MAVRQSNLLVVCLLVGVAVPNVGRAQTAPTPPPGLYPNSQMQPGYPNSPAPPRAVPPVQMTPPQMTAPPMTPPQMTAPPMTAPQMTPPQMTPPPMAPASAALPAQTPAPQMSIPPSMPGVCIEKHGPDVAMLHQQLSYEIIVRNPGTSPMQARVEDELPAGAKWVSGEAPSEVTPDHLAWTLNMEPGVERRIQVKIQPAGTGEYRATATVHYTAAANLRTRVVQPRLVLAMRGPDQSNAGDSVPFHVSVSNPGDWPANNLVLRCKLPEGLTHPQGQVVEAELGTVGPGETRNVTLTTQAAKTGQFTNEMTATADAGLEASAKAAIQILGPNVQLSRTGPARCYLKSEVGFELDVANSGPVQAGYVEVGDTLPNGLEFVSATDGGRYDPSRRTISWRLPALAAGGHQKIGYRVKATSVGEMPDRAAARADHGPDAKADSTFTVEGIPALSLEVVDLEDPIEVGGDLTYEIRVVNQGSCPCSNIQITCQVPDGLQAREGNGPSAFKLNGTEAAFEPLAKLAVKADAVYRVKVKGMQPGDYRFRVQMTCEQLRQPVMKEEASRVYKDGP